MAPFGLALFGDSGDSSLPDRIEPCAKGNDAAFEKFIDGALVRIYNESSARSADGKALRASCKPLLDKLREDSHGDRRITAPLEAPTAAWVLEPLRLAAASSSAKLVDPALGCLHKLVAYSFLQGENTRAGRLDDETIVSHVVAMVAKCGESSHADVQLSVIRALLTITTAEHFRTHGDCLVQAVRTMFNVAVGADNADVQRAARSAVLQMLNTVLKHVTQYPLSRRPSPMQADVALPYGGLRTPDGLLHTGHGFNGGGSSSGGSTPTSSRTASEAGAGGGTGGSSFSARRLCNLGSVPEGESLPEASPQSQGIANGRFDTVPQDTSVPQATDSATPDVPPERGPEGGPEGGSEDGTVHELSTRPCGASDEQLSSDASATQVPGGERPSDASGGDSAAAGSPEGDSRAAPEPPQAADGVLVNGAGTHADIGDSTGSRAASWHEGIPQLRLGPGEAVRQLVSPDRRRAEGDSEEGGEAVRMSVMAATRTAQLACLAEQADIRGLERALDELDQAAAVSDAATEARETAGGGAAHSATPRDVRRALQHSRRTSAWRVLNTVERDVLLVITALCKMAGRETGLGAVEAYMHQGKLLALDLVVRLLESPTQEWDNLRTECAEQLRQPLCLALLRNCTSPYDEAYALATRLFSALLLQQRLREGLKAELGAFYPLLLLRPLESDKPEAAQLKSALAAVVCIARDPQLLVDFFVNFDCDLQAANLFERTVKGIARCVAGAAAPAARRSARDALLALLVSLDAWAGPLKDIARESAPASDGTAESGCASVEGCLEAAADVAAARHPASHQPAEEVTRFGAAKEMKGALAAGISAFNMGASKGIRALVAAEVVSNSPADIAAFLRRHEGDLDRTQVGECLGGHEEADVAVMHAYVDCEDFSGLMLDGALRKLLASFRLPGEAQKIDRIMEKFAERYCRDNPRAFPSADGAYLLAFALIMLNTDVHNPMADAQLGKADFVGMCQTQVQGEEGRFEPILPAADLEAMYERIRRQELVVSRASTTTDATISGGGSPGLRHQYRALNTRLASALGLSRPALRQGRLWDKQHGVHVERARLVEVTRHAVAGGLASGNLWHTALHAEHARPMLQVGADSVVKGLGAALSWADGPESARPTLEGYTLCVRLAGVLGLEFLSEACLDALAAAAGVTHAAPPGSASEAVQVAALKALVSIASGSDAATLGGGWPAVLRALSNLHTLQVRLLDKAAAAAAAAADGGSVGGIFSAVFGSSNSGSGSVSSPAHRSRVHVKVAGADGGSTYDATLTSQVEALSSVRGAVHVKWAASGGGQAAVAQIWARSVSLSGDAVVVFFRSLAAISQEELVPLSPHESTRTYCLERLVWCAAANAGRIRMVWGRLWAVVAQHLVAAACSRDDDVALQAAGHLADLGRLLLGRRDMPHFFHQEETLRPFVSVLRLADSSAVRGCCIAAVADAVTSYGNCLGSGWRHVVEALAVALGDSSPEVAAAGVTAAHAVVDGLFREGGVPADLFPQVVAAAEAGVRSPWSEAHSISSLRLLQAAAVRLADSDPQEWAESDGGQTQVVQSDSVGQHDRSSGASGSSSAMLHLLPRQHRAGLEEACHPWGYLAGAFAEVARHDPRPGVADAAAAALEQITIAHCSTWDAQAWQAVLVRGIVYMLDLPSPLAPGSSTKAAALRQQQHQRQQQQEEQGGDESEEGPSSAAQQQPQQQQAGAPRIDRQRPLGWSNEGLSRLMRLSNHHLPPLAALLAGHYPAGGTAALHRLLEVAAAYVGEPAEGAAAHAVRSLLAVIDAVAPILDHAGWSAVVAVLVDAAEDDPLAPPPLNLLDGEARGGGDEAGAKSPHHADVAYTDVAAALLRARSLAAVMLQRGVARVHALHSASMPPSLALRLVGVLQDSVERAAAFNRCPLRRRAVAAILGSLPQATPKLPAATPASVKAACGGDDISSNSGGPLAARSESEGGALLVEALLRCLCPPTPSHVDGTTIHPPNVPNSVIEEAEQRLLAVCRAVVIAAGQDAWAAHEASAAAATTTAGSGGKALASPLEGKAAVSEDVAWEAAVRGPLLVSVLHAYSAVSLPVWRQELTSLYPHLAKLVCSSQPGVRVALGALLRSQMPPHTA